MSRLAAAVATAAIALLAESRPADACSCGVERWVVPADGAVDVPTNVPAIYLADALLANELTVELRDEAGASVTLGMPETASAYSAGVPLYRIPILGALGPAQTYAVTVNGALTGVPIELSFTTGTGADLTPPTAPTVDGLAMRYASIGDSIVSSCGNELPLIVGSLAEFDPAGLVRLTLTGPDTVQTLTLRPSEYVLRTLGETTCAVPLTFEPCKDYTLELLPIDTAGNEGPALTESLHAFGCQLLSTLSVPESCLAATEPERCPGDPIVPDTEDEPADTGGCTTSPDAPTALALLGLLAMRRPRARCYARR